MSGCQWSQRGAKTFLRSSDHSHQTQRQGATQGQRECGTGPGQDSVQAERQLWACLLNRLNLVFCPLNVIHVTVRGPRGITTLTGSLEADAVGFLFPQHLHLGNLLMQRMRKAPDSRLLKWQLQLISGLNTADLGAQRQG